MSSFKITARCKDTNELHEIWCLDDYFGRHKYGYIPNIEGASALTEAQFENKYTAGESNANGR